MGHVAFVFRMPSNKLLSSILVYSVEPDWSRPIRSISPHAEFTECCVESPGQPQCETVRLELTEGGSDAVLCAVFTASDGIASDEDQPAFSVSIEPQGNAYFLYNVAHLLLSR